MKILITDCPECVHLLSEHIQGLGCQVDWEWDESGVATKDGCLCELSHATQSPKEGEYT